MKTAIKSSAIALVFALLSTGVFAATKTEGPEAPKQDVVLFTAMQQDMGFAVAVHKAAPSNSVVTMYDAQGHLLLTDRLSKNDAVAQKGYNLSDLENGDYTIKVVSNKVETKRTVTVYTDENNQKNFFFKM